MTTLLKEFIGARPLPTRSAVVKVHDNSRQVTVRPSVRVYILAVFVALLLVGMSGALQVTLLSMEGVTDWLPNANDIELGLFWRLILWTLAIGGLFMVVVPLYYMIPWKIHFNPVSGVMTVHGRLRSPEHYSLQSLVGLQVCNKFVRDYNVQYTDQSFNAYQLNAVFSDGHDPCRVRIMAHGDYDNFIKDAQVLAEFLGVPLIRSDQ